MSDQAAQPRRAVRIASWNVNSFRSHEGQVLDWLEANDVDVIGLQETMVADAQFPKKGLQALGYEVATNGTSGRAGVALASRLPLSELRGAVDGAVAPFDQPRLVSATVTVDGSDDAPTLRVHVAYAPNGRKVGTDEHRFKLAWFQYLGAVIQADGLADSPTVVLGDLNVAPTDADVWDPHHYRKRNLTSPVERDAFAELLGRGLVDVVRASLGTERHGFTWWNRRGDFYESDRGWRLDHLLATQDLASKAQDLLIDRLERATVGGSDHAPLRVDLLI